MFVYAFADVKTSMLRIELLLSIMNITVRSAFTLYEQDI